MLNALIVLTLLQLCSRMEIIRGFPNMEERIRKGHFQKFNYRLSLCLGYCLRVFLVGFVLLPHKIVHVVR